MSKRRQPTRARRLLRCLAAGVTAAVILVPGVAYADDGPSPTDPLFGTVDDTVGQVGALLGGSSGTSGTEQTPGTDPDRQTATGTGTDDGTADATDTTTPDADLPSLPPQLQDALEQLGVSSECSDAIQQDLTTTLTDIPGSVQAIIDELTSGLGGEPPDPQDVLAHLADQLGIPLSTGGNETATADTPETSGGSDVLILDDLQALVTDLLTTCLPAPPTVPTEPPTPPGTGSQPPVQAAGPPPAVQPVSYPGYAPTGAIAPQRTERSDGEVPLAALGGVVLLVSGVAVGVTRFRTRAAREEG